MILPYQPPWPNSMITLHNEVLECSSITGAIVVSVMCYSIIDFDRAAYLLIHFVRLVNLRLHNNITESVQVREWD